MPDRPGRLKVASRTARPRSTRRATASSTRSACSGLASDARSRPTRSAGAVAIRLPKASFAQAIRPTGVIRAIASAVTSSAERRASNSARFVGSTHTPPRSPRPWRAFYPRRRAPASAARADSPGGPVVPGRDRLGLPAALGRGRRALVRPRPGGGGPQGTPFELGEEEAHPVQEVRLRLEPGRAAVAGCAVDGEQDRPLRRRWPPAMPRRSCGRGRRSPGRREARPSRGSRGRRRPPSRCGRASTAGSSRYSATTSGSPYSFVQTFAYWKRWKRSMSVSGTLHTTARHRSGRWLATAATRRPPLLPPWIARRSRCARPVLTSQSAPAIRSSYTFCLVPSEPGLVPRLAELVAAAQARDREDAAQLGPQRVRRRPAGVPARRGSHRSRRGRRAPCRRAARPCGGAGRSGSASRPCSGTSPAGSRAPPRRSSWARGRSGSSGRRVDATSTT